MFKRNSIEKNRSLGNKLDGNYPNLYGVMKKKYDTKNFYSNFGVLNNRKPEEQFYAVTIPDYVTVTYSCMVYTYYVEQLNGIVEAINYASDSYWGNPQRYQFKAAIDTFNIITEVPQTEIRVVKSTFDIKLFGYIIPNTLQNNVSSLKKFRNKAKLIFGIEATSNDTLLAPNIPVNNLGTSIPQEPQTFGDEKDPRFTNPLPVDARTDLQTPEILDPLSNTTG